VQLLQLVHGRTDERLATGHAPALDALTARGYVGREDGEALHAAYEFLRTLERRIQP
jgi:glutamate-ammonia-ligase adenylyltransferase